MSYNALRNKHANQTPSSIGRMVLQTCDLSAGAWSTDRILMAATPPPGLAWILSSLRGLTLNECLEYFKAVLSNPKSAEAWPKWWSRNEDIVRSLFSREHYLKLKFRKLDAARQILIEQGLIDEHEFAYHYPSFGETHCRTCGHELFWAIPKQTTRAQIVAFAKLIGSTEIERDGWIHPGVYCPNGCTLVMYNYGSSVNWNQITKDATNNPVDQSGGSAAS